MARHGSPFLLSMLVFLLAGCAGLERPDRPADLPMHSADHDFFDLHWRLEQGDGVVRASGLVEAARTSGIEYVVLELRGLDRGGRVVSHAFGRTFPGRLHRGDTQPFTVRLQPTGREERFELGVWSFAWAKGVGS